MHSFKKIISFILVVCVGCGVFWGLDFALYPCTFIRNDIHAVCTESFQDVYLGTSHGKMNIDPASVEDVNGRTGHNLCVGGEYSIDAYYLTRLMLEKNKPERIIYEVSPGYFTTEKEEGNNYLLFYHEFPLSMARLEYFADSIMECNFRTMLFPWYEYPLSYELGKIKDTVYQKATRNYDVSYLKGTSQEYHENGFIERYPVDSSQFSMTGIEEFRTEDVIDENMVYLEKLIDLCKENEIEFIAVTTPIPAATLVEYQEQYDEAWDYFSDFFQEQEVEYLNFNREYYSLFSHSVEDYTDYDGHMNGDAARRFSRILGILLQTDET